MNSIPSRSGRLRTGFRIVLTILLLIGWPVFAHVRWIEPAWPFLHGVPAFFLGLVVWVMVGASARLAVGTFKKGPAWLGRREALGTALLAGALVVSVVVLFYSVELWRGKRAWAAVAREAAQRGESLDLKSLVPPPVPEDQDFAHAPIFAPLFGAMSVVRDAQGNRIPPDFGPLTNVLEVGWGSPGAPGGLRLAPWMEGQPTGLEAWLDAIRPRRARGEPAAQGAEVAVAVLGALVQFEGLFEELRAYSDRPDCRLPFDYDFPYFSESHSDRVLITLVRLLRLRTSAELASGRDDAAFQDLRLILRLLDYQRRQPTLYYQEARAYAVADGLQPLWEGLQARRWTASQLESLQRALQELTPIEDFAAHARMVALANAAFVEAIIPTTSPATEPWSGFRFHPKARQILRWTRRLYPTGWSLQDQAAICQLWLDHYQPPSAGWAQPFPADYDAAPGRALLRGSSDPFFAVFIAPRVVLMNWHLREYVPFAETVTRLARLACALERQRLVKGTCPETLAELVPGVLEQVPLDPMSGGPFGYRPVANRGFVLYSVGSNGRDDDGQPCPRRLHWKGEPEAGFDLNQNDWVWTSGRHSTYAEP